MKSAILRSKFIVAVALAALLFPTLTLGCSSSPSPQGTPAPAVIHPEASIMLELSVISITDNEVTICGSGFDPCSVVDSGGEGRCSSRQTLSACRTGAEEVSGLFGWSSH
jgi:hypothetical protein